MTSFHGPFLQCQYTVVVKIEVTLFPPLAFATIRDLSVRAALSADDAFPTHPLQNVLAFREYLSSKYKVSFYYFFFHDDGADLSCELHTFD